MNRRDLLAALAALPLVSCPTRAIAAPDAAGIAEDVAVLRAAMAIHPGLHRYLSPGDVARHLAAFERDYAAGARAGSCERCFLVLSRFLTTIRCGHSYPNFFNQRDPAVKALFDRPTRLPFDFEWIGRSMVVTADHSGTGALPRGSHILSVDGRGAGDILDALMPYTRADGHNDGKRRSLLGVRGAEDIEYFDVFQGLLLPPKGGVRRLSVRRPDGRERRLEVPAIGIAARQATMTRVREDSDAPRWTYWVRPDGVAVLDMPGWAMWNSKWDWRRWLSDRLDDAATTRGLVIDLRRNEGGDDCGDPILARLIERDLVGWTFETKVRFREVPAALAPHVSTWDNRFRRLGVGGTDLGDGWYGLPERENQLPIRPDAKRLGVPVAALIGPANSSATFGFINAARASGRIRLLGEATGGNRRGINGGGFFFTTLPGSGIEFDLPLIGYFPSTPQPDAGIEPDVRIPLTADAIAAGTDPALEAAATWLAERSVRPHSG
ncbi:MULTISPECIES: S41 family peptidase [unclassified Sphingomonas]|uniref:S41 family peptidase n=1 Tax=unclassified Sphingomonas TaxID=196159 RepID=UPI0006F231CB|nr:MULTISPECIES: S41 family peptidase [unclassified Sphingomonas]KQM57891.1 peptidase S41 [Sphingomonas sp. Leaf16]KQN12824.1 peptidase S41 [Sphingomonas sp. Leaf29]KQN19711.1 peptidase S41 [Sphingomonas sp. Leaf32]